MFAMLANNTNETEDFLDESDLMQLTPFDITRSVIEGQSSLFGGEGQFVMSLPVINCSRQPTRLLSKTDITMPGSEDSA